MTNVTHLILHVITGVLTVTLAVFNVVILRLFLAQSREWKALRQYKMQELSRLDKLLTQIESERSTAAQETHASTAATQPKRTEGQP